MNQQEISTSKDFDTKKRMYFSHLGFQIRDALKLHKASGLWREDESGQSWKNVTEHCLAEAARSQAIANLLGFSEDLRSDFLIAARIHDFNKQEEIKALNRAYMQGESLWNTMTQESERAKIKMRNAGINERVIKITDFLGLSFQSTEDLANKPYLTEVELACLAMHYIDDISTGSNWVKPYEINCEGKPINQLDRRFLINQTRPLYAKLNEESRNYLPGEDMFEAAGRIGHLVEQRFAQAISEKQGIAIDPKRLPELIDQTVKNRIQSFTPRQKA